jgi:hypothetical protein
MQRRNVMHYRCIITIAVVMAITVE